MPIGELLGCLLCIFLLSFATVFCVKLAIRFQEHIRVVRFIMCFVWMAIADVSGQGMVALAGAVRGQPQAEVNLGLHYLTGSIPGTFRKWKLPWPQNCQRGNYWLEKAGNSGSAAAQAALAQAYMDGNMGLPKDGVKACTYLKQVMDNRQAEKEIKAEAGYNLYQLYKDGDGVPANPQLAARFCGLAADYGNGYAAFVLAKSYEKGDLVNADYGRAYLYYKKAVDNGCGDAAGDLARLKDQLGMK
ncbi:MAG TPA: tetratricopeptide repeat protein [Candidatus Obscuribacterales bacterium]